MITENLREIATKQRLIRMFGEEDYLVLKKMITEYKEKNDES